MTKGNINVLERTNQSRNSSDKSIVQNYDSIVKSIYDKKFQKWFKLKDISNIKNISYRSLKGMVGKIYEKYSGQGLILRQGRRYFISYRLLDKFRLERPRKQPTIYSYEWKTNISWTTIDNYDVSYHKTVFMEMKENLEEVNFLGCIEEDSSGRNHVHLIADSPVETVKTPLEEILEKYLDDTRHFRLYCAPIQNIGGSVDYLMKNPQSIIN